jgi:hypothetical protein
MNVTQVTINIPTYSYTFSPGNKKNAENELIQDIIHTYREMSK